MNRLLILLNTLFILLLVSACSTNSKKTKTSSFVDEVIVPSQKAPIWYLNPQDSCPESYLCAAGIGDNPQAADISARNNLALYFKAQVKSSMSSKRFNSSRNKKAESHWESYGKQISEETDFMLKRSFMDKRLKVDKKHYSYVILDTLQLGREYKEKIIKIDKKMLG
ncbi:hypothetical protein N9N67_09710, partial [Bacteriovoracaceae bacterium]|nr:hypothetical protein [Bacteriovoracaceae bacterium]